MAENKSRRPFLKDIQDSKFINNETLLKRLERYVTRRSVQKGQIMFRLTTHKIIPINEIEHIDLDGKNIKSHICTKKEIFYEPKPEDIFFHYGHKNPDHVNIQGLGEIKTRNRERNHIFFFKGDLKSYCKLLSPKLQNEDLEKAQFVRRGYRGYSQSQIKITLKTINNNDYDDPEKEFKDYQKGDSADWIGF